MYHRTFLGPNRNPAVQNWIDAQSKYLKTLDTNHLVGVGVEGFYGQSTPTRLTDNPSPSLGADANGGNPAPFAAICEGQDFSANHAPQVRLRSGFNVASQSLYLKDMTLSSFAHRSLENRLL